MKKARTNLLLLMVTLLSITLNAQELKVETSSSININDLPEYVVITSENTKFLGGIDITIDYKNSSFAESLEQMEDLLQSRKKLKIRNQTDLLNALSKLGFEYVDTYNAGSLGSTNGNEDFGINESKARVNMVFRKKEKFRN